MHAGGVRQVARLAVLGRHREHLAARSEERPLPVRRNLKIRDIGTDIAQPAPAGEHVLLNAHRHLLGLLARQIELVDVAAVFEHDGLVPERGELAIELGELRDLVDVLRLRVERPDVEALVLVPVGEEGEIAAIRAPAGRMLVGRAPGELEASGAVPTGHPDVAVAFILDRVRH